jgi:hypothetical protein
MKKYLVIYHVPASAMAQTAQATPEQQAKGMEMWMNWAKRCGDNLLMIGSPLVNGQSVAPTGNVTPSTKNVSGYSIVQAENMEGALKMMDGHPHLMGWHQEATIEVHEAMPIPGM